MNSQIANMLYHQERSAANAARISASRDHNRRIRHASLLQDLITFDPTTHAYQLRAADLDRVTDSDLRRQLDEFLLPVRTRCRP